MGSAYEVGKTLFDLIHKVAAQSASLLVVEVDGSEKLITGGVEKANLHV